MSELRFALGVVCLFMPLAFLSWVLLAGLPGMSNALLAGPAPTEYTQTAFMVHRDVEEVRVPFSVHGTGSRTQKELRREDLTVLEDEQQVSAVTALYRYEDAPLRLIVMLDTSDSMATGLAAETRAGAQLLTQLAWRSMDQSSLTTFAVQQHLVPQDRPALLIAALQTARAEGQTTLYDTIYDTAQRLLASNERGPVKRVVILLSDGEDNWSKHNLDDVIIAAQGVDLTIYAVTAHSRRLEFAGDRVLRRLAESTGGRAFVLDRYDDIGKVLASIQADMKEQYVLAFRPADRRCGFHTLKIQAPGGKWRIRARSGYFVSEDGAVGP